MTQTPAAYVSCSGPSGSLAFLTEIRVVEGRGWWGCRGSHKLGQCVRAKADGAQGWGLPSAAGSPRWSPEWQRASTPPAMGWHGAGSGPSRARWSLRSLGQALGASVSSAEGLGPSLPGSLAGWEPGGEWGQARRVLRIGFCLMRTPWGWRIWGPSPSQNPIQREGEGAFTAGVLRRGQRAGRLGPQSRAMVVSQPSGTLTALGVGGERLKNPGGRVWRGQPRRRGDT